jgi:hypothetical protein
MLTKKERNIFMKKLSTSLNIKILKETIAWFKSQIKPHDCGWMYTTIDGLKHRIKELRKEKREH